MVFNISLIVGYKLLTTDVVWKPKMYNLLNNSLICNSQAYQIQMKSLTKKLH